MAVTTIRIPRLHPHNLSYRFPPSPQNLYAGLRLQTLKTHRSWQTYIEAPTTHYPKPLRPQSLNNPQHKLAKHRILPNYRVLRVRKMYSI